MKLYHCIFKCPHCRSSHKNRFSNNIVTIIHKKHEIRSSKIKHRMMRCETKSNLRLLLFDYFIIHIIFFSSLALLECWCTYTYNLFSRLLALHRELKRVIVAEFITLSCSMIHKKSWKLIHSSLFYFNRASVMGKYWHVRKSDLKWN